MARDAIRYFLPRSVLEGTRGEQKKHGRFLSFLLLFSSDD
jgi:hypothetical protein